MDYYNDQGGYRWDNQRMEVGPIFVLSLPKNGTTSLQKAFESINLNSLHWVHSSAGSICKQNNKSFTDIRYTGFMAQELLVGHLIQNNILNSRPALSGKLSGVECITQGDYLYWTKGNPYIGYSHEPEEMFYCSKSGEYKIWPLCPYSRMTINKNAYEWIEDYLQCVVPPYGRSFHGDPGNPSTWYDRQYGDNNKKFYHGKWHVAGYFPQFDKKFIDNVLKHYHNAKFILSTRDPKEWITSISKWNDLRQRFIEWDHPLLPHGFGQKDNGLEHFYKSHVQFVKKVIPSDRLLLFDLNEDQEIIQDKLRSFLKAPTLQWGHFNKTN